MPRYWPRVTSHIAVPNPSSALDITSTTKGLLPPRMTMAQRNAIVSPAEGLLVYKTDNTPGIYQRTATAWIRLVADNLGDHTVTQNLNGRLLTGSTAATTGCLSQGLEPFLAEIMLVSFNFAPKGWALCNGQLLPINQNQALLPCWAPPTAGMENRPLPCLT